jgi:hypothetical protein
VNNLIIAILLTISLQSCLNAQIDPFATPNKTNLGPQATDPFAAPTGVSGDPFEDDDPLSQNASQPAETEKKTEYVDELPVEKKRAVVIIEGDSVKGTGFVAKINNVLFVVTNIHVIKDNKNLKFMTMDGDILSTGAVYAAKDYDIAILRLAEQNRQSYFEIVSDVFADVSVGTEVLIPGNSLGDGTILQTRGSVIAVGPKLLEHNAPTFAGNSGSPIIKMDDWKVIGVDTLSTKRDLLQWFNQHSKEQKGSQVKADVRLFGYRIDNIKEWEKISFNRLHQQHENNSHIKIEALSVLSAVWGTNWHYQRSDTVSRIINRYIEKTSDSSLAIQDVEYQKKMARSALFNHLRSMKQDAIKNKAKAYELMKDDYSSTIAFCDELIEYVGRYYESDSSNDPFETR